MLELAGENLFKVRAYENGARAILSFPGDLEAAVAQPRAAEGPGDRGRPLRQHRDARRGRDLSPTTTSCARGFRRACANACGSRVSARARPDSSTRRSASIRSRRWRGPAGKGGSRRQGVRPRDRREDSQGDRARALERRISPLSAGPRPGRRRSSRSLRRRAWLRAIEIAGSLRRRKEIVRDIDIVAASGDPRPSRRPSAACRAWPTSPPTARRRRPSGSPTASPRICASSPQEEYPGGAPLFHGIAGAQHAAAGAGEEDGFEIERVRPLPRRMRRKARLCLARAKRRSTPRSASPTSSRSCGKAGERSRRPSAGTLPALVAEGDLRGADPRPHDRIGRPRHAGGDGRGRARDAATPTPRSRITASRPATPEGSDEERVLAQREEIRALRRRVPRLPDLPRHGGRHPGGRLDRLRRRVPREASTSSSRPSTPASGSRGRSRRRG